MLRRPCCVRSFAETSVRAQISVPIWLRDGLTMSVDGFRCVVSCPENSARNFRVLLPIWLRDEHIHIVNGFVSSLRARLVGESTADLVIAGHVSSMHTGRSTFLWGISVFYWECGLCMI